MKIKFPEEFPKGWFWERSLLADLKKKCKDLIENHSDKGMLKIHCNNLIVVLDEMIGTKSIPYRAKYEELLNKADEEFKEIKRIMKLEKIVQTTPMWKRTAIAAMTILSLGHYAASDAVAGGVDVGVEDKGTSTYSRPGSGHVGFESESGQQVIYPGDGKVGFTSDGNLVISPGHENEEEIISKTKAPTTAYFIERAKNLYAKNDKKGAIETLEKAAGKYPKNEITYKLLGEFYLRNGDFNKSSNTYEKLIRINPNWSTKLKHLVPFYKSKGVKFNPNP